MNKKDYNKEFWWERIHLTGAEIFALQKDKLLNNSKPKFVIGFSDGNYIQRDYIEWPDEQVSDYKKSLKNNFPHTPFYLLEKEDQWYIVDGQHRLETILKIIRDSNKDDEMWILKKSFEFIICKHNNNLNFEKFGSDIFTILNDKAQSVSIGALCKSLFFSKDKDTSKMLIKKYSYHFKTTKARNSNDKYKVDEIFVVLANASFLIHKKEKIKDVKMMKKDLTKYLESEIFNKKSICDLLKVVNEFISKDVFNKKNIKKKPKLQTLYVSLAIGFLEDKGVDKIKKFENFIDNFEKEPIWNESNKNTRTPHQLYYKYIIIKESNNENELLENTRKFLK